MGSKRLFIIATAALYIFFKYIVSRVDFSLRYYCCVSFDFLLFIMFSFCFHCHKDVVGCRSRASVDFPVFCGSTPDLIRGKGINSYALRSLLACRVTSI